MTADWVVLTAALVGLGLTVISVVFAGLESISEEIAAELARQDAETEPFTPGESPSAP